MSKFRKILALLLAMLMVVCTLGVVTGATDGGGDELISSNGLVLSKKYNDGKLTLEAYVTGKTVTESKIEPVDVVLVLDVSGSMDNGLDQYEKVYTLDEDETYFIYDENSKSYNPVYHCDGAWIGQSCEGGWFTKRHWPRNHGGTEITPKSSVDSKEGVQFYRNVSKLDALQSAATQFVELVAEKSPNSNIALVKFAGEDRSEVGNETFWNWSNWSYYNYSQTVMELTKADSEGISLLQNEINKLVAGGATQADFGMQHAQKILENSNTGNKQVVIMFTDGEPNNSNGFVDSVANDAISASAAMKAKDVTVYTIGCFDNPNASEIEDATAWNTFGNQNVNKYMNIVSSNCDYTATNMSASFSTYKYGGYYKTATSSTELSEIFKELSEAIGGAEITLNSETVLKDVISDYFDLPTVGGTIDKSGITAHTETCTAIDADGKPIAWSSDNNSYPVGVSDDGKTLTVTGFDYSENWVGSHEGVAGGKKMVVTIPIIDNGTGMDPTTPTNTEESGIYNDGTLVGQFEIPKVDFSSYTIKHIQNGTENTELTETLRINGKDSLTDKVSEGYLYGGAFEDEEGYTTPITFADSESGLSFTPTHGETYCIWEVSENYLKPKCLNLWAGGAVAGNWDIRSTFFMVAIDRLSYYDVGFDVTAHNGSTASIAPLNGKAHTAFDSVSTTNVYGTTTTYTAVNFGVPSGYIACYQVPKAMWQNAEDTITYTPYWITLDGVKVYSTETRLEKYLGEGAGDSYKSLSLISTTSPENKFSEYQILDNSIQTMSLVRAFSLDNADPTPITPTVPEGYLEVKYFEQGWFKVYGMTLLSAIDNGDYSDAGFKINGVDHSCNNIIESYGICSARILFGDKVSRDSKLMTYNLSLRDFKDGDTISVTPYWTTEDGTAVYGTERVFTYNSRGIIG